MTSAVPSQSSVCQLEKKIGIIVDLTISDLTFYRNVHTPDLGLSEDVENHGTLRKVKSKIVAHFESKTA